MITSSTPQNASATPSHRIHHHIDTLTHDNHDNNIIDASKCIHDTFHHIHYHFDLSNGSSTANAALAASRSPRIL